MSHKLLTEGESILETDEYYNPFTGGWDLVAENWTVFDAKKMMPVRRLMTAIECRAEDCLQLLDNLVDIAREKVDCHDGDYQWVEDAQEFIKEMKS